MNSLRRSVPLSPFHDLRRSIKIFKAKRPLPAVTNNEKNKNVKQIKHFVFRKQA
jgi:hypothetical protein